MTSIDSWAECATWFDAFAADEAYSWASFFPTLLRELPLRQFGAGLYAHRWATTVVVSRFGVHPDWADGPKIELLALPGHRLEVKVYEPYNQKVNENIWHVPFDVAEFDLLLRFVAGEGDPPQDR